MTRYVLAACVAAAALATPAAAEPVVAPCPHGSDFYYGYNRGAVVTLPGYDPIKFCIEI